MTNDRPGLGEEDQIIPDVLGALTGYRYWRIIFLKGGKIRPISTNFPKWSWSEEGNPVKAECWVGDYNNNTKSQPPHKDCPCGLYSMKEFTWRSRYKVPAFTEYLIAGSVKIWGRVIVHETGYRSEYAQMSGVFPFPFTQPDYLAERVSQQMAIPMLPMPEVAPWRDSISGQIKVGYKVRHKVNERVGIITQVDNTGLRAIVRVQGLGTRTYMIEDLVPEVDNG